LPIGDADANNVEAQRDDPNSVLHMTHELVRLRATTDLGTGVFRTVSRGDGVWVFQRGGLTVAANLSGEPRPISLPASRIVLSSLVGTDRAAGVTSLEPWEALVVAG
jgi:glycosidase